MTVRTVTLKEGDQLVIKCPFNRAITVEAMDDGLMLLDSIVRVI